MTWRVYKLKRKLVLLCHGGVAYEVLYKDLFDTALLQRSIKDLSRSVTNIWFELSSVKMIKKTGTQAYVLLLQ